MADFGSPVAQNVDLNPSKTVQTLSGLLGLQQQRQALDTGAFTQQSAKAKATVDTQGANENQALAQLLQDPVGNGIVDKDGNPTADGQAVVMKAAPTTGADAYGKVVNAARTKIEFNTSVNALNQQERQESGGTIAAAALKAHSPQDLQTAMDGLLAQKQGTPVYNDYKKINDTLMQAVNHVRGKEQESGTNAPPGQEPWRLVAKNLGVQVLGAAGVVGAGGVGNPGAGQNAAGQNQLVDPTTGARSMPALSGGATNPASPQVAGQTTRQVQTGNADIDTSNGVVASQRDARANVDLTKRIDQLAEVVRPGAVQAKISQGLGALGLQDVNQARTELDKDLARLKGNLISKSQSDTRAGPVLDSLPDSSKPSDTIHQTMDMTRGLARQDLALGKLREKSAKATGGQMSGFQGDYAHAVAAASPLMHEYLALSPQEQVGFFQRNFKTKDQAKAFRAQAESVKKLSPDVIGQ